MYRWRLIVEGAQSVKFNPSEDRSELSFHCAGECERILEVIVNKLQRQ
jgi:hypothetical protein